MKERPTESAKADLEHARLLQERELRERELTLKDRELELRREQLLQETDARSREITLKEGELSFQREQSWWAKWSTPAVAAILAGLIGYVGTLISSAQNRKLERDKQEGTLILEAIKTAGAVEERERLAAANLVFLADAGLITSIRKEELEKLRVKKGSAGPSLPAAQGVEFTPSSALKPDLRSKLEAALSEYQSYLTKLGYTVAASGDRVSVRIDEVASNNAFFDNKSIVIGPQLAYDPEYVLSEYTWYALKETNPRAFESVWNSPVPQFQGFMQGVKFYITCSYLGEPIVGRNFYSLIGKSDRDPGYLFNLGQFKPYERRYDTHELGEVWGGALWELREQFTRERVDRWVFTAWKQFVPQPQAFAKPGYYIDLIVAGAKDSGDKADPKLIQAAFERRNLTSPRPSMGQRADRATP